MSLHLRRLISCMFSVSVTTEDPRYNYSRTSVARTPVGP